MHGNIGSVRRARIVRRHNTWTFKEGEVLRSNWPDIDKLKKLLPHRTENAIRHMASKCGLVPEKNQNIWTCAQDRTLKRMAAAGEPRRKIADALGLTVGQVANRLLYKRINIAKRPPKLVDDPLVHAIRQRAFALNITATDLDRSLGDRRIFGKACAKKPIRVEHIARAAKALGGSLTIEWCDQ